MPTDFTQLEVWKKSIIFCKEVYSVVKKFPEYEQKNIVSQLRRASVSISTNVAEGCGKYTIRDETNFFRIAQGSTKECMSLIFLSKELGYLNEEECSRLFNQAELISKMFTLLIREKRAKYEQIMNNKKSDPCYYKKRKSA